MGLRKVGGVREVDGFAFGAGGVDVDEDDLGDEAGEEEGVGGGYAYGAGADDDDLDRLGGGLVWVVVGGGVDGGVYGRGRGCLQTLVFIARDSGILAEGGVCTC